MNACPKCEVPTHELGTNARSHRTSDYARYQRYKLENQNSGSESNHDHIMCHNLAIGQNIFHSLDLVSASDLYQPKMLNTIYFGLFKHMIDWIEGFLKKHGRLQAFDDVWKVLPPYPGFLVTKKGYREVTQWQGKEMWNQRRCILGVLALALRQPGGEHVIPFKRALGCIRALVNFNMMAQYRSHMSDTIAYIEDYLDHISKKKRLHQDAPCAPSVSSGPGAENVNSRSGCVVFYWLLVDRGPCRQDAPDATKDSEGTRRRKVLQTQKGSPDATR